MFKQTSICTDKVTHDKLNTIPSQHIFFYIQIWFRKTTQLSDKYLMLIYIWCNLSEEFNILTYSMVTGYFMAKLKIWKLFNKMYNACIQISFNHFSINHFYTNFHNFFSIKSPVTCLSNVHNKIIPNHPWLLYKALINDFHQDR